VFYVSNDEFVDFIVEYYKEGGNGYPIQRIGQAFLNKFSPPGHTDPELFYTEIPAQAMGIIFNRYVRD